MKSFVRSSHFHIVVLGFSVASVLGSASAAAGPKAIVVLGEPEIFYAEPSEPATPAATGTPRAPEKKQPRSPEAIKVTKPEPPLKRWVCGNWEELWQGHGQGRTCEWR